MIGGNIEIFCELIEASVCAQSFQSVERFLVLLIDPD